MPWLSYGCVCVRVFILRYNVGIYFSCRMLFKESMQAHGHLTGNTYVITSSSTSHCTLPPLVGLSVTYLPPSPSPRRAKKKIVTTPKAKPKVLLMMIRIKYRYINTDISR